MDAAFITGSADAAMPFSSPLFRKAYCINGAVLFGRFTAAGIIAGLLIDHARLPRNRVDMEDRGTYLLAPAAAYASVFIYQNPHDISSMTAAARSGNMIS